MRENQSIIMRIHPNPLQKPRPLVRMYITGVGDKATPKLQPHFVPAPRIYIHTYWDPDPPLGSLTNTKLHRGPGYDDGVTSPHRQFALAPLSRFPSVTCSTWAGIQLPANPGL